MRLGQSHIPKESLQEALRNIDAKVARHEIESLGAHRHVIPRQKPLGLFVHNPVFLEEPQLRRHEYERAKKIERPK